MERRAAQRRDGIGAGERVDAATVGIRFIRPDRFRDQHAAAHAIEVPGVKAHLAARVAEHHLVAVGDVQCGSVRGMDHHLRPALARTRGRHLGEG
jgi:hypothetical protein